MLKRRASNEKASEMREHPEGIRYALLGCVLSLRSLEVTDDVTRRAIELIHRLDTRWENQIYRELLADLKRVDGKIQILSRITDAVVEHPEGIVRDVIFPQVKEETFRHLKAEFASSGAQRQGFNPSCRATVGVFPCFLAAGRINPVERNRGSSGRRRYGDSIESGEPCQGLPERENGRRAGGSAA